MTGIVLRSILKKEDGRRIRADFRQAVRSYSVLSQCRYAVFEKPGFPEQVLRSRGK